MLILVMVLACIIRLFAAYLQSFSNDELSAIYRLQFNNFSDLLNWGIKMDGHPAFVQLFLYYYTPWVPKSELWIRLPFVLASTLSLGYIFFSIKKLSGEFAAYMVLIILAFSGFSIQLGYFARPYAFGILFSSAAAYYWIKIFIDQSKAPMYLLAFLIFSMLASFTHYFALLEIVLLGLAAFIFAPPRLWWKIILVGVITLVAFIPHYFITAFQMNVGGIGGWLGKPNNYFIIDLLFEYFDRSAWIIAAIVFVCLLKIIIAPVLSNMRNTFLMLFLSIAPFSILFIYSIKINPVLQFSACYFLMPFLLGAFFSFFETGNSMNKYLNYAYIPVFITFLISSLFVNNVFAPIHFAEFKKIAQYIEKHESDSVTTVVAVNNPFYIDYYLTNKKPDLYITDMGDQLSFFKKYVDTCTTTDFIYAFANQRSNIEIPVIIEHRFPINVKIDRYLNSELYHFSTLQKNAGTDRYRYSPARFIYNTGRKGFQDMVNEKSNNPVSEILLKPEDMYSPALDISLTDYPLKYYHRIIASADIWMDDFCDLEMVISIEEKGKPVFWRSRKLSYQYAPVDTNTLDSAISLVEPEFSHSYFLAMGESLEDPQIDLKNHRLKIYIMNPNQCSCMIQDFSIWLTNGNYLTTGYSQ